MIIDGKEQIVGRVAAHAANQALLGNAVDLYNCEEMVMSGPKKHIISEALRKRNMGGPRKGPFNSKMPDRYVKRIIRGMLPYKQARGLEAFKRVRCYMGAPDSKEKTIIVKGAHADKLPNFKYLTIGEVCAAYGWQK